MELKDGLGRKVVYNSTVRILKCGLHNIFSGFYPKKLDLCRLWLLLLFDGVLIVQRDLGTAIVISLSGLMVYFLSGAPLKQFFILIPTGLIGL